MSLFYQNENNARLTVFMGGFVVVYFETWFLLHLTKDMHVLMDQENLTFQKTILNINIYKYFPNLDSF